MCYCNCCSWHMSCDMAYVSIKVFGMFFKNTNKYQLTRKTRPILWGVNHLLNLSLTIFIRKYVKKYTHKMHWK